MDVSQIFIACDHGGYGLKMYLFHRLTQAGRLVNDLGCHSADPVDYPDYACRLARQVLADGGSQGILICGTGIGMTIAANKFKGVRAALCRTEFEARLARQHNNANVLCLGGRVTGPELAAAIVDTFLTSAFDGGRHSKRLGKISGFEEAAHDCG